MVIEIINKNSTGSGVSKADILKLLDRKKLQKYNVPNSSLVALIAGSVGKFKKANIVLNDVNKKKYRFNRELIPENDAANSTANILAEEECKSATNETTNTKKTPLPVPKPVLQVSADTLSADSPRDCFTCGCGDAAHFIDPYDQIEIADCLQCEMDELKVCD